MDVKGRSGSISIDMPALVSVDIPDTQIGSASSGSTSTTTTSGPSKPIPLPRNGWTIAKSYVPVAKQLFISGLSWGLRTTASAKIAECASCMGYSDDTAKTIGEVVSGIGVGVSQLVVSSGLRTLQEKLGVGEAVPINQNKFKLGQSVVLLGNLAAVANGKFGQEFPLLVTMGLSAASGAGSLLVATTGANLLGMEMKATQPSSEAFGQRLVKGIVVGGAMGAIGAQIGFGTDNAKHAAAAAVSHRTPFIVLREIADRLLPPGKAAGKPDLSDIPSLISDPESLPVMPQLVLLVSEPNEPLPGDASDSGDDTSSAHDLSRSQTPDTSKISRNSLSPRDFATPNDDEA